MPDRITNLSATPIDVIITLSEGNPGAVMVLSKWHSSSPMAIIEMLILDTKRLYGPRIWELYKDVCGEDFERFKYHVQVELPNQETGVLSVTGPFSPDFDDTSFWEKRTSGRPDSFWALDNPPTESDYVYPIK